MNIGYLIDFKWNPPTGGGTVHAYQVAKHLMAQGHTIHTLNFYDLGPDVVFYRQRQIFKFLKNIDLLYIRIQGSVGVERWTLLKLLKPFSLPVVWEINSPLEELLTKGRTQARVDRLNAQRKAMAGLVKSAICVSKPMQEYAQQFLNIKDAYVVPNGSDPLMFSPEKRDRSVYPGLEHKFKVIWSGSANYSWQGVDLILKTAQAMRTIDPSMVFILMTDPKELRSYGPLGDNMIVLPRQGYADVPKFLASADAALCLYHLYGWRDKFYFSSLKLYDYMASALPVIATNIGQINEAVKHEHSGYLTNNSIDEVVKYLLDIKNHPEAAKRLGLAARKAVEDFYNWERVGKDTEKILLNAQATGKKYQEAGK